jgi:hypothetical protein
MSCLLYEKVVQMRPVDAEITQVDNGRDGMPKGMFNIVNLFIDCVIVAVRIAEDQNHQTPPS